MSKFILTSENDKKWNVKTDNIMQQNNYKQAAIEEASFEVSIDDEESLASEIFLLYI